MRRRAVPAGGFTGGDDPVGPVTLIGPIVAGAAVPLLTSIEIATRMQSGKAH